MTGYPQIWIRNDRPYAMRRRLTFPDYIGRLRIAVDCPIGEHAECGREIEAGVRSRELHRVVDDKTISRRAFRGGVIEQRLNDVDAKVFNVE